MFQQVLEEPGWLEPMMPEDLRAMTPLIYHHVNPYSTFELDMAKRLPIDIRANLLHSLPKMHFVSSIARRDSLKQRFA